MAEPLTVMAVFSGLLVELLGAGVTATAGATTAMAWKRVSDRLERARIDGKLPENHHLERATTRAALTATKVCIQLLVDTGRASFLDDEEQAVVLDGVVIRRDELSTARPGLAVARAALWAKLSELIDALEPQSDSRRSRSDRRAFQRALAEGAIALSAASMDRLATSATAENNPASVDEALPGAAALDAGAMRSIRRFALPGLEAAVVQQTLRFGNWAPHRREAVAAGLRKAFFGADELWVNAYAHCYVAELRADTNLFRLAVLLRQERMEDALASLESHNEALKHGVDAVASGVRFAHEHLAYMVRRILEATETATEEARGVLREAKRSLAFDGRLVFYEPGVGRHGGVRAAYRPFYFAEEEDSFVGRDDVLELLSDELLRLDDGVPSFRWAAVCGEAGTGKSRLGLHLLKLHETTWRLSGFVQRDFIEQAELTRSHLAHLSGPTLFVVDYTGSAPEACCRFIERCAAISSGSPFPIRVLVLVRRSNDRFFEYVGHERDGPRANNARVRFSRFSSSETGALVLAPLSKAETLDLMRQRMAHAAEAAGPFDGAVSVREASDDRLLNLLRRYDERMRPLFAVMVADAFQRGILSDAPAAKSDEEARLALFWDYLEHQFNKRWKHLLGTTDVERERIDKHVTFLIFSTMCRGLTDDALQRAVDDPKLGKVAREILPHSRFFFAEGYGEDARRIDEDHLLASLSGARREDYHRDAYPILEPDLIGEALALMAFDPRGGAICMQRANAALRSKFLRDLSWRADPDGAAFFCLLVAQDYPARAQRLDWLLPSAHAAPQPLLRAKLFRNLALATVDPLTKRAAELEDIERIAALVEKFRPSPSDPSDAHLEYATGLAALADQLSFVVNKSVAPRSMQPEEVLADKLGKRKLEFGRAASERDGTHGVRADFDAARTDGQAIFRLQSDKQTVDASLRVLRHWYSDSLERAFSKDMDLDVRVQHVDVVCKVLASVFWSHRSDRERFGFADRPLSTEEAAERRRLSDMCQQVIASPHIDEGTLAVVTSLVAALMYAEDGDDPARGERVFDLIHRKAEARELTKEATICSALVFLRSHAVSQAQLEITKPPEKRRDLGYLCAIAELLLALAAELPSLSEDSREQIAHAFFKVCGVVANFCREQSHTAARKIMLDQLAHYRRFTDRCGATPLMSSAVDFFVLLLWLSTDEADEWSSALSSYHELVCASRFDYRTLNAQYWDGLTLHLIQLMVAPSSALTTVQALVKALLDQIGPRVNREIVMILTNLLPHPQVRPEVARRVAALAADCEEQIVGQVHRAHVETAVTAHTLVFGDESAIDDELEGLWTMGDDDRAYRARASVLNRLPVLACWYGLSDARVRAWRQRLLDLLRAPVDAAPPADAAIRRAHDSAAVAAASTFARLEIAAGASPDEWLLTRE